MSFKNYFRTFIVTSTSPAVFTCTDHNLYPGDAIILNTTGALYTGLTASSGTTVKKYYVLRNGLTSSTFQVSADDDREDYAGTPVNTSGLQSGAHTFMKINRDRLSSYKQNNR